MSERGPASRWLVTGATGFLGANLGQSLRGRVQRIGAVRTPKQQDDLFDEYIEIDLIDETSLAHAVRTTTPDVIVHSAALAYHDRCESDPTLAFAMNTRSTEVLHQAAAEVGATFVFISTDAVFDGTRGDYSETDEPHPTSVYGESKVRAEQAVLTDPNALVVRTNFFGWSPSGTRSILEFFVSSLRQGTQVRGFTDFTVTSGYTQELCEVLWQLAGAGHQPPAPGLWHVTASDALTKYDFGVAVAEAFGLDDSLITPTTADIHPPRNGDISLNTSKIATWLGRPLASQRAGIERARTEESGVRRAFGAPGAP